MVDTTLYILRITYYAQTCLKANNLIFSIIDLSVGKCDRLRNCYKLERHGQQLCKAAIKLSLGKQRRGCHPTTTIQLKWNSAGTFESHRGRVRLHRISSARGHITGTNFSSPGLGGCNANLIWIGANKCCTTDAGCKNLLLVKLFPIAEIVGWRSLSVRSDWI